MNADCRKIDPESLFQVACDVLSRETLRPFEVGSGDEAEAAVRRDLVGLEVLLRCRAGDLFPLAPEQTDGCTGLCSSPMRERRPYQIGAGHHALALAAMLAMAAMLLWAAAHPVGMPTPPAWRSAQARDLTVFTTVASDELGLEWYEAEHVSWYRVSVVDAAGAIIARRDLDRGCTCRVRVRLPDAESTLYWMVEGFDSHWSRVAVAAGRVDPGER